MQDIPDEPNEAQGLPSVLVDPFVLLRQKQALLAKMFGVKSELPRFEHYVILDELGRGGMGVVYAAHDEKLDRKVAIKKLHGRGDPQLQRRLVREAQVMAKLAHPNVVTVYEIGETDGATFIVMEYVEGVTLRQWLTQTPRSRAEILTAFKAAAHGLIAAHEKGLVHRDFKPDNVMLGDDGRVRVMDFGLARSDLHGDEITLSDVNAQSKQSASQLTRSGALLGTLPYMAPEQLRAQQADAASDQFGYCVALYEALYGQRPFEGVTREQRLSAIERGEVHQPPRNSAVPNWLRRVVLRGLEPMPRNRFGSMQALLSALVAGELAEKAAVREPPEYVFVAHNSLDKQVARRLCEDLLDRGVRPWLDIWDLPPNPEWRAHLLGALKRAPAVLVCHGRNGWQEQDGEFAQVLRIRIEEDPGSVYRVGLPGAAAGPLPVDATCEGIDFDEGAWDDSVGRLVTLVGADHERGDWLGYEANQAGVSRDELCPYRGLEVFKEKDARWMFGRDEEIGELLEFVRAGKSRFLTVIGASGSGKSSLVMAGLCPVLRNGGLGDGRAWEIYYLRPGTRPCESLAHVFVSLQATQAKVNDVRAKMLADSDTLCTIVKRLSGRKILLVLDQLEELFTEAKLGRGAESSEAISFVRNLLKASNQSRTLWVVSTLRADFVQRCLEVSVLARVLKSGAYLALPPMKEQQIRAAIERPARRVGFNIDPKLVEKLVSSVAEQPGRLPLLQHVLRELWQRRDEQERVLSYGAYAETMGLKGAIAAAAERALSGLREPLGKRSLVATRRVMTRLVHIGEGTQGDTRRRVPLDELGRDDETRQVLNAFVRDARVLVSDRVGKVEVIEIAHEALLREWQTLVAWLDADRGALRMRQELGKDVAEFKKTRNTEYFWGKGRLEEARRVLASSTVELNDDERIFLEESSRSARNRSLVIRGTLAMVFAVLVGALVFIASLNVKNQRQASENE